MNISCIPDQKWIRLMTLFKKGALEITSNTVPLKLVIFIKIELYILNLIETNERKIIEYLFKNIFTFYI